MHDKKFIIGGKDIAQAKKVLIMLHGRGADANDILGLASHLNVDEYAQIAPEATNNTWYPKSFLSPIAENEPWLSAGLSMLGARMKELAAKGFSADQIYFLGFSQGACLTLEFVTRNAVRYGGIVAFTGGLIGDKIYPDHYGGDFDGTPVLIAASDPDPHVPVDRVEASAALMINMNAAVTTKIYKNMGHTITADEIALANDIIFKT